MAQKNKSGREVRKPKQEQNKRKKGQTPPPSMHDVHSVLHPDGK